MEPIEGVNLKELVEECHITVKREMIEKRKLEKLCANYWAEKAQEHHNRMLLSCGRSRKPSDYWNLEHEKWQQSQWSR